MDFFSPAAESETPAPVQSEPIEDIEIIPENEVPKGSPPVDLSAEFAELNQESGNVMAEDDLRKMTTQGEETAADEALDPSQMYSGISMANDRINALQTESPKIKEWREKNTQRIEDADKKEETDGVSWKEQAKIQKDEFYKQYETENAKRKAENRASEVNNVISAPDSSKVAWEQLGSFINFNASRGAHETDKSRMKSLLFKLKQEPPKVPSH